VKRVDFVLPWVNGNDTAWQKRKAKYTPSGEDDANSDTRFRDMSTLRYVLRSIEQHCPWYNKIFLITEGHYPEWLDIGHEKIVLVTHEELYFNKEHLPTFSSSSIEMNLPNLKGLSDHFIYLNDDTIIMRPLEQSRFFVDSLPVDFFSHGWIPRNKLFEKLRGMDAWGYSLKNNLELINKKFAPIQLRKKLLYHHSYDYKQKVSNFIFDKIYKKFIWIEHWHHPVPYLKSTLKAFRVFEKEMMTCSSNRFRANNDLTQYIYRYMRLAKGEFYPYRYNDGYDADIISYDYLNKAINDIEKKDMINFVCFNDQMMEVSDEEFEKSKALLDQYLKSKFSNSASFEVDEKV
jgi:hypothetical protein